MVAIAQIFGCHLAPRNAFLETYTEDAAAEALFTAFYEAAPSLQHLFKTSRAVA